jgi:hypothetical protein
MHVADCVAEHSVGWDCLPYYIVAATPVTGGAFLAVDAGAATFARDAANYYQPSILACGRAGRKARHHACIR